MCNFYDGKKKYMNINWFLFNDLQKLHNYNKNSGTYI